MTIVESYLSESRYPIKSPYPMTPEFVVIHNTANSTSAANEVAYMKRNSNEVSFHYAVDDLGAIAVIPENRNAWHAGDGPEGEGNRKGISIEICYSSIGGELFDKAEANAALLVSEILARYGWGVDKVKKHDDFSATSCPHRTKALGWERFLNMVRLALNPAEESTVDTLYAVSVLLYDKAEAEAVEALLSRAGYLPTVNEIGVKRKENAPTAPLPEPEPTPEPEPMPEPIPERPAFAVGDSVKVKPGAKTYTGGNLATFVYNRVHKIAELSGDRAVITYNGAVAAAMRITDLMEASS